MPRVYLGDAFGLVWRTIVLTLCAKSKGIGSEKQRLTCKLIRWFRCSKEKKIRNRSHDLSFCKAGRE